MSHYNDICATCTDKQFIEPGTERSPEPRHAQQERDSLHRAVPVPLRSEQAQRQMLDRGLALVRERFPQAVSVVLETSDQDTYGFMLREVLDADGNDLLAEYDVAPDDIADQLTDLEWDGVVGEDDGGYALLPIATAEVIQPETPVTDLRWKPATNGTGKLRWFLARGDSVPVSIRYHENEAGRARRYGSYEAAKRVADRLNAAEAADLPTHGFVCKKCDGPSPAGVGYAADGKAAGIASTGLTACGCGHSQLAPGVTPHPTPATK